MARAYVSPAIWRKVYRYRSTVAATTLLATERAAVAGRVTALEAELAALMAASEDSNADDEAERSGGRAQRGDDPEGQTIAYERAQLAALLESTRARLAALDAALARVDAGTYGTCERCGRPIAPERLAALPATARCIGCA